MLQPRQGTKKTTTKDKTPQTNQGEQEAADGAGSLAEGAVLL